MTKLSYPTDGQPGRKFPGKRSPRTTRGSSTSTTAIRTGTTATTAVSFAPCASVSVTGAISLRSLYAAWREARRGKKPSNDKLRFETFWIDNLIKLQGQLERGAWQPSPPTCFVAKLPKAREIHAPDFADRVVHHWLVPQLEQIYEPIFIHDSYSNRVGKGSHAAVDRLRGFVRQVANGQGGGWYLQLDIHNFFNSIHRPTLYALLKDRMTRHGLPWQVRRAVHALLRTSPLDAGVKMACSARERARIPAHKQLANAAPGCGIAIGNLSSQFFANVYLNELDQFVKHELRAQRYLRYVDDFVLVHHSREQLLAWRNQIERFLADRLRLALKADQKVKPLSSGVDFLGYIIRPTHSLVRRRVIQHARQKLCAWRRDHVRRGGTLRGTPADFRQIQSIWTSYVGHFSHASSGRLHQAFHSEFPWLRSAACRRKFSYQLEGRPICVRTRSLTTCGKSSWSPERSMGAITESALLSRAPSVRKNVSNEAVFAHE
jgi:RNA-directed DNA polymerase